MERGNLSASKIRDLPLNATGEKREYLSFPRMVSELAEEGGNLFCSVVLVTLRRHLDTSR
jgi:hypothetical protein